MQEEEEALHASSCFICVHMLISCLLSKVRAFNEKAWFSSLSHKMLTLCFHYGSVQKQALNVKHTLSSLSCFAKLSNKYLGELRREGNTLGEMLASLQDHASKLLPNCAAPCFLGVYVDNKELTTIEFMCARHKALNDLNDEHKELLGKATRVEVMWCVERCHIRRNNAILNLSAYRACLKPLISDDKTNIVLTLGDMPPPYLVKQALLFCSKPDYKTDVALLYVSPERFDLEEAGIDVAFPNLVEFRIDSPTQGLPVRLLTSLAKLESLEVKNTCWPETLVLPKLKTLVARRFCSLRSLNNNIESFQTLRVLVLATPCTDDVCRFEMSSKIGVLKELVVLKLKNVAEGQLPTEIGLLKNLRVLDLSSNYLCGDLPKELSQLKQLAYLNLNDQKPSALFNHASFGVVPDEFTKFFDT